MQWRLETFISLRNPLHMPASIATKRIRWNSTYNEEIPPLTLSTTSHSNALPLICMWNLVTHRPSLMKALQARTRNDWQTAAKSDISEAAVEIKVIYFMTHIGVIRRKETIEITERKKRKERKKETTLLHLNAFSWTINWAFDSRTVHFFFFWSTKHPSFFRFLFIAS